CGNPIPPERLEVFPGATHCAACQEAAASADADIPDYCPRCGSIMTLRATGAGGVQRYAMKCPQCGCVA
ncbi:MAG: TraR/DksA C4-type zinc finger protein, partial [Planctomycetes bacterium]|nr:TraR/DksA C4-type zinc finger protein [Planctomycetota bacterium]